MFQRVMHNESSCCDCCFMQIYRVICKGKSCGDCSFEDSPKTKATASLTSHLQEKSMRCPSARLSNRRYNYSLEEPINEAHSHIQKERQKGTNTRSHKERGTEEGGKKPKVSEED